MSALHALAGAADHVVPQVVEAELAVGAVGDVWEVLPPPLTRIHIVLQTAYAHAQKAVDLTHPLAIALGKVIVHSDDMDTLAADGIQVRREWGDKGLSLASPHFGDHPPVQDNTTHELNGEVTHPKGTPGGFPHGSKGLWEQVVELLSPLVALPKIRGHATQFLVRHGLEAIREVLDLVGHPLKLLLTHALTHREGMRK